MQMEVCRMSFPQSRKVCTHDQATYEVITIFRQIHNDSGKQKCKDRIIHMEI